MQDKPVIDGIECRYWFRVNPGDYRKCSLRGGNDNCDEIKDCFIKELLGKLALKEQECEELKEEIKHYKQIAQYHGNLSVKYTNKSAKLKQTLTEIKEIAKNMNKECFYDDFSCDGCDMINGCTYQGKLSVLQKISECEVENAKN